MRTPRIAFASISAILLSYMVVLLAPVPTASKAQTIDPPEPITRFPRHASFVLDPAESWVELSLFYGGSQSRMGGNIGLYLGDPDVAVVAIPGMVGLSVDWADLVALDFQPDLPGFREPFRMIQNPRVHSIGSWNTVTGQIAFDLYLIGVDPTNASPNLPVPMPIHITGVLTQGVLKADGNNGNVPDGTMKMHIKAFETPLPPTVVDAWFSTNTGFHPAKVTSAVAVPPSISDGDLLSVRGYVVRTNHQLTARLGIMPIVPDLGLDAVLPVGRSEIWFSFKQEAGQIWSETLGCWLTDGDLLSDRGRVVMANEKLLANFVRMGPVTNLGLDAISRGPNREILFSTEEGFFCENLGVYVGRGDLLSTRGRIVRTNAQLLANFRINDPTMRPTPADYGLDAVAVRSNGEIWFSTEIGFPDERYGWVSDGDLLSTNGTIIARNRALLGHFQPIEDLASFGLDALSWAVPCLIGDFDFDGDVDAADFDAFSTAVNGPALSSRNPDIGDMDGDGDTDQTDFGIFQRCVSGSDFPADVECGG